MKRIIITTILTLASFGSTLGVFAQSDDLLTHDGNLLLEQCKLMLDWFEGTEEFRSRLGQGDHHMIGNCAGKLQGAASTLSILQIYEQQSYICPPEEIAAPQIARIVVKYLDEHPEHLHYNGASLTLRALRRAYPCD